MKKLLGILLSCSFGLSLLGGAVSLASKSTAKPVAADTPTKTITVAPKDLKNRGNWKEGDYDNIDRTGTTTTGITFFGGKARWHDTGFRIGGGEYFIVSSTKYTFLRIDFTLDVTGQSSAHTDYCYYMADDADGANIKSHRIDDHHGYWEEDTPKNSVSARNTGNYMHVNKMVITVIAPTYNVTYDANGGSGETIDATDYVEGTKATLITSTFTAPEGKAFSHWNTKADNTGTSYKAGAQVTMNSDITLYAQYANKMTVSVNGFSGGYDGLEHTGEVTASVPESGYTVNYGTEESSITLAECPKYTDVGEHTVYYAVTAAGYGDERGSFQINITENDKTELDSVLENAVSLYESLDSKTTPEAVALYDAIMDAQYVSVNENVTVEEIQAALDALLDAVTDCGRQTISDEPNGVTVETGDGEYIPNNITLSVEVKTDVKAEQGSAERAAINAKLASNEAIVKVFSIKLIKTVDGVQSEIQPSDIKEGMKLIIHISVPEGINTETLKILHIHNSGEIEFVEGFKVENNEVVFEVSSLSELAFVQPNNTMLPGWAIALIVIGGILLGLLFFLIIMFIFFSKYIIVQHKRKVVRVIKIRTKNTLVVLLGVNCKTYKRPKELVYKTKEEALKVLEK